MEISFEARYTLLNILEFWLAKIFDRIDGILFYFFYCH